MTSIRIGVLAEDETDCRTVAVLIRRVAVQFNRPSPGIRTYAAKGCAQLRRKAAQQMRLMAAEQCVAAIIVHDLDRNPENDQLNHEPTLRQKLESLAVPSSLQRLVCIPIEEIEAWFWSDEAVLRLVAGKNRKVAASNSPHLITKPKEALQQLSAAHGKARRNTNANEELAQKLDLAICERRCPSFRHLAEFVRSVVV